MKSSYAQRAKLAEANMRQRMLAVKSVPRDENRELPEPVSRNDYLAQISLLDSHYEDLFYRFLKYLKIAFCTIIEYALFLATAVYLDSYRESSRANNLYVMAYSHLPFIIEAIILRVFVTAIFNNHSRRQWFAYVRSVDRDKSHHLTMSQITNELDKCKKFVNNLDSILRHSKIASIIFILLTIIIRLNQFINTEYQPFHLINFIGLLESSVQLYRTETLAKRWLEFSMVFHQELKKLTNMNDQFSWSFQPPTSNGYTSAALTIAKKYKFMNGDIDGKILKRDFFYIFSGLLGLNCHKVSYGLLIIGAAHLSCGRYQQAKERLMNMINKRLTSLHQKQLEKNEAILNEITTTAGLPCWTREEITEDDGLPSINFLLDLPDTALQAKLLDVMRPYFSDIATEDNMVIVSNSRAFNRLPDLIQAIKEWNTARFSNAVSALPANENKSNDAVESPARSLLSARKRMNTEVNQTTSAISIKVNTHQQLPATEDAKIRELCRNNPIVNLGNNRWCIFNEAKIGASASAQRIPNDHIDRARNVFWRAKTGGPQRFVIRGGEIKLRLYGSEGVGDLRPRGKLIATTDDHQQVYELERFKRHNAHY